jgi:hypothetical protein
MKEKDSRPGTIPFQPDAYSVEEDAAPWDCDCVDGPTSSDINSRNIIHDYRPHSPVGRHGGIARFIRK